MAHHLNFNDQTGQHSFFSVNEKAWHGLGKVITHYPTSSEALQYAGLKYTVEKRPLFTIKRNIEENRSDSSAAENIELRDSRIVVPESYATVRTDTEQVLGIVSKNYHIVQNEDAFSFFDSIVGGDGMQYETAGALGNGERIFITAKLPGYIKVGRDDLIEKYLFLTTSHDGMESITAAFTPVRIVCANTLNAALRTAANAIKIRHTTSANERLALAHEVMGISNKLADQLQDIFNQWSRIFINDVDLKKLIQIALVPSKEVLHNIQQNKEDELSTCFKNITDKAFSYAMENSTQQTETTRGTLFGAYNSVTGYFQNVKHYKDKEAKIKSILYGGIAQIRGQKAFDLCSHFANKGNSIFNFN